MGRGIAVSGQIPEVPGTPACDARARYLLQAQHQYSTGFEAGIGKVEATQRVWNTEILTLRVRMTAKARADSLRE